MHATSLRGAKNGILQRARLFRFHDGDSAHWFVVVNQTRRARQSTRRLRVKTTTPSRAHQRVISRNRIAIRNNARLSRAAGSSMLASAAPRRSSFARSSSLARPCSSGSTTPSAGISNCHARARTKRASSVSSTRENVTVARIDLDRESRGSTTRAHRVVTLVKQTPFRFASTSSKRLALFAHARARRHAPVGLEHRSSSVFALRIDSSVRPSTRRRGVRAHSEKDDFWNSNRLFRALFESRTVK